MVIIKQLYKIESRCLPWPHKILAKTIGEMSVYILGYTNAIIQWMIVLGYNTLLNVRFKLYLAKNVHCTFS
ncbi:hypothetical protein A9Q87_09100 [Flavobacteriales bacterium 34_180_T64]|nr:hypothetical protein A9Q87_09100 [Flavobacteriales bacterium 34_180_T64]